MCAVYSYNMHVDAVNCRSAVTSAVTSTTMTSTMMCVYSDWFGRRGPQLPQPPVRPSDGRSVDFCTRQYGADFPLEARGRRARRAVTADLLARPVVSLAASLSLRVRHATHEPAHLPLSIIIHFRFPSLALTLPRITPTSADLRQVISSARSAARFHTRRQSVTKYTLYCARPRTSNAINSCQITESLYPSPT